MPKISDKTVLHLPTGPRRKVQNCFVGDLYGYVPQRKMLESFVALASFMYQNPGISLHLPEVDEG